MVIMIATIGIVFTGVAAAVRLFLGPTLADRVAALDVALISVMSAIALDAAHRRDATYLDLLVVLAIVGFTATVAASRFIEHEGPQSEAA